MYDLPAPAVLNDWPPEWSGGPFPPFPPRCSRKVSQQWSTFVAFLQILAVTRFLAIYGCKDLRTKRPALEAWPPSEAPAVSLCLTHRWTKAGLKRSLFGFRPASLRPHSPAAHRTNVRTWWEQSLSVVVGFPVGHQLSIGAKLSNLFLFFTQIHIWTNNWESDSYSVHPFDN